MQQEDARQLLHFVNDPNNMTDLKHFVNCRIREHKKALETCELKDVQGHQSCIYELRKYFCNMREYIISKAQ